MEAPVDLAGVTEAELALPLKRRYLHLRLNHMVALLSSHSLGVMVAAIQIHAGEEEVSLRYTLVSLSSLEQCRLMVSALSRMTVEEVAVASL